MANRASNGKEPVDIPIITESDADLSDPIADLIPPTCASCGRDLVWSGRGRKPTKCRRGEGCQEKVEQVIVGSGRTAPKTEVERIRQGMTELYVSIGVGVAFFDQFDGFAITQKSSDLGEAWAGLAEQDPKVRKALMKMLTGTSWSGVIAAHFAVAIPILQHHKMIPQMVEQTHTEDTH